MCRRRSLPEACVGGAAVGGIVSGALAASRRPAWAGPRPLPRPTVAPSSTPPADPFGPAPPALTAGIASTSVGSMRPSAARERTMGWGTASR